MSLAIAQTPGPAQAGPPFVSDDPEPTDTGHFEDYFYTQGTHVGSSRIEPGEGLEINYGVFKNTQLSWSVPFNQNLGSGGMGLVWEPLGGGVKYRFIQEDSRGWRPQIALFPQVFFPVGEAAHDAKTTELLPIWIQKSVDSWTSFGGGGFVNNPGTRHKSFFVYGWALQRQINRKLAIGMEGFGQTRDSPGGHSSAAVGIGGLFDFNDTWHLIGSMNTGIVQARQSDSYSLNLALKFTE